MKSTDAPYSLVLTCAGALAELVKVREHADQAESFRPKLGELSTFLAKYSEVRNELGKRLSSGRLNDKELRLVRETFLSLSGFSESLGTLAAHSEWGLSKNLPALAGEIANDINIWQVKASQSSTADLDQVLKYASELENEISRRFKKASELDSRLCECRSLIEYNESLSDSQHSIFKAAADLLAEAQSITSEKLTGLLTKSKKWSDDHEAFSKDYENLVQLLSKGADDLDRIIATSTDACRQSLCEYYGQIASWLAEVRTFLGRAAKISSRSALALGEHSKLKQSYIDSQNLIESLRSKIAECESMFSDEEYARAVKATRKKNFIIALLGTFGAAIGFVWLSSCASMFAVAVVIGALGFLCTRGENDDESSFWTVAIVLMLGLSAVGVLFMGADWLLGWLFNSWSLIGWLPKWLAAVIPLTFGAILALSYAVTMGGLVFRNFLPLRRKKPQALESSQNEFPAKHYHVGRNGTQLGTLEEHQIRQGLANGSLLPTDLLWADGMADWTPVEQLISGAPAAAVGPGEGFDLVLNLLGRPAAAVGPGANAAATLPVSSGSEVEPTHSSHLLEAEIPAQLLSSIRDRLKREYRGNSKSQTSKLESQIESYRALRDIVAQPPEGFNRHTLAKIVNRAQREYPLDLQIQLYVVEQQIEGHAEVEHLSCGTFHSDVPGNILNKIVRRARLEYEHDYVFQSSEIKSQISSYIRIADLSSSPVAGMTRKQVAIAIADAESEYPDDYSMQVYHIEAAFEEEVE